jgi:hypothetical protein
MLRKLRPNPALVTITRAYACHLGPPLRRPQNYLPFAYTPPPNPHKYTNVEGALDDL